MKQNIKAMNREVWSAFVAATDKEVHGKETPNLNDIAKATGYSPTTLSLYRKGTYTGDVSKLEVALVSYLGLMADRRETPGLENAFVVTQVVERVYQIANLAQRENEVGLLVGKAGVGKTEGLRWYLRDNPACLYISANHAFTPRVLFAELLELLNLPKPSTLQSGFRFAVSKLRNSDRLIIVDQAEYLSHKALEMLRSLHDETGCGLLLVGLPRLYHNIRSEGAVHEQVYSRIGVYHSLDDKMTDQDVQALFKALTGTTANIPNLREVSRGNARRLVKLAKRGKVIASNHEREIDAEIIDAAAKYLVF